jgi:hypothetical protein
MLDCHSAIWGGPEFLHLPDIAVLRGKLLDSADRGWIDAYASAPRIDALLADLVESLLLPAADAHGKRLLSEKSPPNVFAFESLLALFPAARFVLVLRDPRAVVASLLQVGERARQKGVKAAAYTYDVAAAIAYTRKCLDAGFAAQRAGAGRIHTVVYEQLVQDPEREGRRLCEYLDIPWEPQMLRPGDVEHAGEKAITESSGEVWYDKASYRRNIEAAAVDGWRRSLSLEQQLCICEAFAGYAPLRELGYGFTVDAPAAQRLMAVARVRLRSAGEVVRRRLRRWL